jgi:hypothetical protein
MKTPTVQWGSDLETDIYYCRVIIPYRWLMEASHFKRRLQLWWWLTRLAWSLPK